VSKLINGVYPNALVIGNQKQPREGSFEIKLENRLIFSKFEKNRFPTKEEISKW
tara:strand:- start:339 stop:500 length:162 start_codon:yes stop_codon:yes gene_type:complete